MPKKVEETFIRIRVPIELARLIDAAALANSRSRPAEIAHRLHEMFPGIKPGKRLGAKRRSLQAAE